MTVVIFRQRKIHTLIYINNQDHMAEAFQTNQLNQLSEKL